MMTPCTSLLTASSPFLQATELPVREPQLQRSSGGSSGSDYRVILYNDDWHPVDDVVVQVQKATACSLDEAVTIVVEVHTRGRGICFRGSSDDCQRVAAILREIRLQCEVDCD